MSRQCDAVTSTQVRACQSNKQDKRQNGHQNKREKFSFQFLQHIFYFRRL